MNQIKLKCVCKCGWLVVTRKIGLVQTRIFKKIRVKNNLDNSIRLPLSIRNLMQNFKFNKSKKCLLIVAILQLLKHKIYTSMGIQRAVGRKRFEEYVEATQVFNHYRCSSDIDVTNYKRRVGEGVNLFN